MRRLRRLGCALADIGGPARRRAVQPVVDEGSGRFVFSGKVDVDRVAKRLGVQIAREGFETLDEWSKEAINALFKQSAEAAGIKPFMRGQRGEIIAGDIIVAMDNKLITNVDEFLEVIERHNAGDTIIVTVLRGGTTVELPVKLGPAE